MKQQKGTILVLLVITVSASLALLGLVVGLGIVLADHSKLQNNANLAALGALEAFLRQTSPPMPVNQRVTNSIGAAQNLLAKNKLLFMDTGFESIDVWDGGVNSDKPELQFGGWFGGRPFYCSNPASPTVLGCSCARYPCFAPIRSSQLASESRYVTAVRLQARTPKNSITAPFLRFIKGSPGHTIQTRATARAVTRCSVFIMDVSNSSFEDSHERLAPAMYRATRNPTTGLYELAPQGVTIDSELGNYAITTPPSGNMNDIDCSLDPGIGTLSERDARAYWCSMEAVRPATCISRLSSPSCNRHYRSDYEVDSSPDGRFAFDKFRRPEPLASFTLAINSALRRMNSLQTSLDRVALLPFSNKVHGAVPADGLTSDLSFPIDITDMRRAGTKVYSTTTSSWTTTSKVHPNYIDRNWFPVDIWGVSSPPKSGSDILLAMNDAINRLTDETYCPADSKRTIIMSTDGIMTNWYNQLPRPDWANPQRISTWANQVAAENLLLRRTNTESIVRRLIDNKIRLSVMLTGNQVEPNFRNVEQPPGSGTYLTPFDLPLFGYKGISGTDPNYYISNSTPFVPTNLPSLARTIPDCLSNDPDRKNNCARIIGVFVPNALFRRPNGVFADLAVLSKGIYCPLMEPYRDSDGSINSNCYDPDTKMWRNNPGCSRSGSFQTKSIIGEEKGGQAAYCTDIAFGGPPFGLVTEEK
jgi:hypothetical protein